MPMRDKITLEETRRSCWLVERIQRAWEERRGVRRALCHLITQKAGSEMVCWSLGEAVLKLLPGSRAQSSLILWSRR